MASSENTAPKKTIPIAQWSFLESRLLLWGGGLRSHVKLESIDPK
jgi:hypothetical protein